MSLDRIRAQQAEIEAVDLDVRMSLISSGLYDPSTVMDWNSATEEVEDDLEDGGSTTDTDDTVFDLSRTDWADPTGEDADQVMRLMQQLNNPSVEVSGADFGDQVDEAAPEVAQFNDREWG